MLPERVALFVFRFAHRHSVSYGLINISVRRRPGYSSITLPKSKTADNYLPQGSTGGQRKTHFYES
jgi:hypothetical protein